MQDDVGTAERMPGIMVSLRRLLKTFTEILYTRAGILSTELEEMVCRIQQIVIYGVISVFFLGLGVVLVTLWVVMAFWESYPLYVLGGFAIFYLSIGALTALAVRQQIQSSPRLFSTTLSELGKDRDSLESQL